MLTLRCYPPAMVNGERRPDEAEMTEFGRAAWSIIQERGAYSRAGIGRKMKKETGWGPSRQSISNYLNGDRNTPRELVPALVKTFNLNEEEALRLEYLYFYGQGGPASERWRRAQEAAEEEEPNGAADKEP